MLFQLQPARSPVQDPPNLLFRQKRVEGRGRNPGNGWVKSPSPNPRISTCSQLRSSHILNPRHHRSRQKRRSSKSTGKFHLTWHSAICTVQRTRLTNGRHRAKEVAAVPQHRHPRAAASRVPALNADPHQRKREIRPWWRDLLPPWWTWILFKIRRVLLQCFRVLRGPKGAQWWR